VFHHDLHTHPFIDQIAGVSSGTFVIPNEGETSTNVWYRIHLSVTDSTGLVTTTYQDITPRVANLTLQTVPAGLQVTVDGSPVTTPLTVPSVVGMLRTLGAPSQTVGSFSYSFTSWSDGRAATHTVTTPSRDATSAATHHP